MWCSHSSFPNAILRGSTKYFGLLILDEVHLLAAFLVVCGFGTETRF